MTIGGNLQLINQICAKSGLQGKDLENLRTNLQNLSKQELEAELVSLLVSGKDDSNKGLQVEQSASAVLLENYQKTYYYDKKGNIITEYKDGDYVIERIIKGKDEEGNEIETTITYRNNRPRTKVVNKNGQREEVTSFTYNDKSDTNFIPSVTVETTKADNTVVKSEVLAINGYNGDFDLTKVTERETTKPDGTVTNITKILNILIETQKRPDGTVLTTYYNGTDIEACDNNQLHKVRQTVKMQGQEGKELCFDGEGNTIVTVNAGDGWERLARRFHTTEKKLKELNPKIKNLKAGQDILIPNEFDIESKEIGKVQPREEAFVQAWNAEVDRQIAQKVTENISNQDSQELKKAGVKPTSENYIFYQKFSQLNPSQKQNVLSMIKYYKAQGVTDLNEIKTKILETYPDVNLFDSGKLIRFYQNNNMGIGYFDRFNPQQKGPIALETFITDILKLNLKTEPGKTVYERMASIPQDKLDNFNASNIGAMTGSSFENIANCFLTAGINIFTESEYQLEMMMRTNRKTETEKESEIRAKTVDFAYQLVHKARLQLDAYLAEIKDHYIKNFGTIVWEGLKAIPTMLLPDSWTSGSGEYEALVKNISVKSANLYVLEGDILRLKGRVNSDDFEAQYKKLLNTDYSPEKINNLMNLAQNQPDKNSPDYAVYEKQMEKAIKDVTGKDFTKNVSSFINWSKGAGSLVETAIFCYVTAGMGEVINVGGQTVRAVTVAGKTFTTATTSGAAMVMARNFGKYAFYRANLNFIDDIDNLLAPMTLEEKLRGRKDVTLGGMFIGENNADQVRGCLSAIKDWATGKITRDQADEIIKKSFKNLSFDDFVSSNGGQVVLNTVTSSIFGAAAGAASPWFQKAGEIGTKWGQKLGLSAPNIQQVTADLIAKNPAGINAAEFMAKTYEALHATNIAGKGLQFLVETAVFYCTNLPLTLIQETLSESNGELEQAIKENRLGSYLIGRFGDEALNLLKVKSIGTIIAMMMGTTNIAQIKENFEDYDVLKNTTIRYEDATIQNPDGTFTSGKAVVLDGPTGKLYVDGSSAKFYTAQGQLVVSENLGAQAQFMEMNEGIKTTFLLGKFMQIERYVKSLQNPVEDAVDLSMPYKPSSQEQQVQIAIDQIAGQKPQQPTTAPQAIINPAANQPTGNNNGTPAVEIPINQPAKNPYEKPSMTVMDLSPQQMVAASSPQQTTEQQVPQTITATPLTDAQKTELHERLQKIAQAYANNNYANIDIFRNLTDDERKQFVDNILHLGSGRLHDDYDFLFFANGEKPAVLLGGLNETPEPYLDKLKSDNIDVFHRVVTLGNGQKRNNTLLINKQSAKRIIGENKELFQKRLGLSESTTVDEIYEKLLSDDSILKDHEESSDLTGLILGYPKYNTMIFRLDKWISDHNIMTNVEMRRNPDIEKYKSALKQALEAEDSPYKNMSAEFKNTLLTKIDEIKEVTPSRILFNNDADGYVFNYTTPEPEELVRIEQSMLRTADKTQESARSEIETMAQVTNNTNNLTSVNTSQEVGQIASQTLANSKHRIATAGYSQNSPEGYEETARTFLMELENQLGDGNTAYVTSPTTGKGSIDAITTEVEGLGDNSIFYTTAQNYISYIGSDNPAIDTQTMQQVPKYVLPDTASYSQATAAASNTFIAIGGKNTTVSDFVNAIKYGNKSVILDSAILDTPAWDSENHTVGNASKYIAEQIQAVREGKPLPYPEVEGFTKDFIKENLDKLDNIVKIIKTDGRPSSLRIAARQAAEFLNEDKVQPLNSPENDIQKQKPIEEIEQEFLDMLSDSEKPRWEKVINELEQYKNSSYEEKVQAISFWLNQAKLTGLLKDNYVPKIETVQQKLEFIEDTKIKTYIEQELAKLNTLSEVDRRAKLLELDYLADAINNLNGHYSMIHTQSSLLDNPAAQAHRIQAINNNSGGELNYSPEAQARIDKHIKYDGIKNFIAKYAGSNPEMAEYLYTQYLNTLSPEVSAKCDEISKKTGVKIFVDNTDTELMKHLNEIQDEYTLWKNAGLKVPNILDEFDISILFILPELQGEGVPVAFTKPELNWQALSICNIKEQELDMRSMLRHELTHLNDPNFNDTIWDENNPIHNEILTNREKYAQYLKDAGANDYMVEYAFSMPREFSAVAMQLDTSKYPDEFKTLLAKMGVPKKALDFEPVTSDGRVCHSDNPTQKSEISTLPQGEGTLENGSVHRSDAPQDAGITQESDAQTAAQQNTNILNPLHNSYVQVVMQPIREIANKFGLDFDIAKLEQTVNSLSLEALKNIADKRSGDEVDWDGLTKEKISEIQKALQDNGFNDDIHLLMFLYANGDTEVKVQRLKDRKDVLPVGTSKDELAQWIKIMNMYDGEYNFYLNNNQQEESLPQEKPDWLSFKTDRIKVTQVLLNQIEDKSAFEKYKTSKGYETDEDAIIPFITRLQHTDFTFKLSDESKKSLNDFVKKYDTKQLSNDPKFDSDYLTNYKQTSYRYTSAHDMALHDLTNKIFDIRRKFNLDEDETFDLDKLNQTLENLPTETLNDLRRIFYEKHIKTKEEALNILNMDFSKLDIASIKSMLEDNDCYSDYALAQFVFATPEEFANIHKKLVTRKDDLPTCEYESQKETWTQIMEMSDEDYNFYKSIQDSYPEDMPIEQLPTYRKLMTEAPEFTQKLLGMKKKKYGFFGNDLPRFTIDEIAQLYETAKTDEEFTMELINHHREKNGLVITSYTYNEAEDIIKIVELTKTYNKEDVRKLALDTIYCDAHAIKVLLELKQSDPELYETFIKNEYPADDIEILKECFEKNPPLTKELMQDKSLTVRNIKVIVDCNSKYFSISMALSEQIDKNHNGKTEDRFYNQTKAEYSKYVLECNDTQRKVFEELLTAKNPDGTYRYDKEIIDLCKLYETDSDTFETLASLKLTNPDDGRVFYATEGIITKMFDCYKEDKDTTLQVIKNYPDLNPSDMKKLYDLLRTEDREIVIELITMRNETDTKRRFSIEDIEELIPLRKEYPEEFEEMLNAKTLQNGMSVYAYDASSIKSYINSSLEYIRHLKSLKFTAKDGNEYNLLSGQQLMDINVVYNIISAEPNGSIDIFNEIVYNPKYKFLLQILTKETAPFICNLNVLDILDKYGIENAKSVMLTRQESDGQRLLLLETENSMKTINLKADEENNVSVIGEEISHNRGDKHILRREFDNGSYLVEEISYKDFTSGEGKHLKIAFSTKKTWYDSNDVPTRSEVMTPVDGVPGEYTINVYERGLNQQMVKQTIGSVKIEENDEGQIIGIEKTLTAPDGTVTKQTKTTEEDGSVSTTYEITGVENGENKVLFSQRRSHVKLDENHYTSSLNGQIYDMKFSDKDITVSKLDDEGNPTETITIGSDIIDPKLMPLFKQLPGDVFFLIHKIGITKIYVDGSIKKNAQYINKTIRISPDLMDSPFAFMHELYHGVSDIMFNGATKNKEYKDTYDTDLANYQAQASNENERIIDYFSTRYHGEVEGREETFAEIGAITSCLDKSMESTDMLGMRAIVVQQNMAKTIAKEMSMVEEGMTKPLPEPTQMTSTGITMITSPDGNPISHLNGTEEDNSMVRVNAPQDTNAPEAPASTIIPKSEFIEKLSIINKYIDEFDPEDDPEIEVLDDMESFGNSAYEIYKQDPEIFNMIFEGKDFNGNPIPEKTSVYLILSAFALKTVKNTSQLRNIVVLLSLYENTDTMKYSSSLGISETDFNLLVAIEKDRADTQGNWRFASGVPAGFNEIYETLIKDMNDVQKRTLTIMLQEGAVSYTDMPELNRRFMTIKTEQDAEEFGKLFKEILPKNEIRPRAVTLLVDKITSPEMKVLADKLLDLFESDLPASSTRLVNIMEAAHLGAYERIVELLENPTKENKEEIRLFGCAVDKSKEKVKLIAQSGILKDRRFSAEQLDNISLDKLYHIIERDLLSSEKNYSAIDILHLADANDKTYNQIVKYDLMKDFTAFDAKSIVENIDDIQEYDLLKYRKILTGKTMTNLCYFPELRNDFLNNPQIQKLGPLGTDAMNAILNARVPGYTTEQGLKVHDFGRELCDDVHAGKLSKYDCENLYSKTGVLNLEFVRDLYQNMDKYNLNIEDLIDIAAITESNEEYIPIARRMVEDRNFPNNLIKPVLRCADEDNMDILEKTCFDPEFPKEPIRDILNFASQDKNNAKAINGLLDNPELKQWFIMNLKNDLTPDLIVNLARTQKKLNIEAQQSRAHRSNAPQSQEAQGAEVEEAKPQDVQDAIDKMVKLGMNANMAEKAYVGLCQDKGGNIDKVKLNAVLALVEAFGINKYTNDKGKLRTNPNISPKEIQEIFAFAVGSALSSANGQFRPDIVKDIIRLRQAGVTDVKLATTLSCIKNMGLVEMKDRFNTKVREDAVKRAEELPEDVKSVIENTGFDLTAVLEKASAEAKGGKVKRVNLETVTLRSLDDIYGDEKILISKHKSDKGFDQKIWGDPDKFREWAEKRVADLMDFDKNPNYTTIFGEAKSINAERKQRLQEWYDYLTKESDYKDNPFVHCLILEEITKELRSDNAATIKPVSPALFNEVHGILIDENNDMSFDALYSQKMREKAISLYSHGTKTIDGIEGQWVTIPQTPKGDPNYDEHVAMVQSLAEGSSWCLKASNANNYIQSGNIHYFIDKDGKAQVAMHEENGEITQIQKRYKQDSSVPVPYVEVIEQYYKDNNLHGLKSSIQAAKDAKPNFEKLKAEVTKLMEQEDYLAVFDALEFKVKVKDDGTYVLNKYDPQITTQYTIADLGIDEDKLMANVSEIEHDMNLDGSNLTEMKKLVKVGGFIKFGDNKISDVRNLEKVHGLKISWIKPQQTPPTSQKPAANTPPDLTPINPLLGTNNNENNPQTAPDITANLSQKQLDIYNLLQRDLKNFGDFDDALKIKIIKTLDKYSSPENKLLSNLFKGILAYVGEPDLIEKICDNDMLLSEINKNAQTVVKLFAHHKNIDKDIRSIVYFNLLLMRYYYPENYSNLTHSKGYQQIMTGGLSIAILKDLKYNDNIDAEYFYNLFDKLEHTAEQTVSNSDELKQYPENHIKSAIELDPSRQDEILGWIKNAKNPTLMAQTLQIVNNTRARFNRNINNLETQGNYVNPNELKQENNYLIDFIKIVSENPEMASILGRFCSYKEISLFNSKLLKANLDKNTQDTLLTLFAENPDKLNGQVAINLVEFVSKAPNKIDLIRKILEKGDSQWLTFISENNADYIEDKMDNSEYGSITFIQTLMLTLAKNMPEMKDKNNWQRIEDCAYLLLEDTMNEYYTGYDKIRDEYKPKIDSADNPQKRRRFNNEFAGRINALRATIRNKIRFMSGVLDMYVNSPEKYEQVKDSGFLDMVKEGKLNPMALIMLNKNSNLSDNLYSDLETVKSGKSIVPEFPDGTPLDTVFKETKTGDAVEVGNKMYINDGKQLVEWQMSKEMFLKLFPPVERYSTLQGALGDCYLVSSMASIMNNPESRVELYKSFKLVGNDVVVTIKSYEDFKGSKTFPNGNITVDMNNRHLIGCMGLMMLEQTYAKVSLREPYFDYLPSLNEKTTPYSLMQRLRGGYENDAMSELLGLTNLGSMPIPAEYNVPKKSSISFKITDRNTDSDKVKNYLAKYAGKENFILHFATIPKDKEAVESLLLKEYNLVSSHAYIIVGYNSETGIVKISNPHNTSVVTEIPFSELIKYMNNLIITNLNE